MIFYDFNIPLIIAFKRTSNRIIMEKKFLASISVLSVLIAIVVGILVLSPTAAEYNKKADILFDQMEYSKAFKYYKKAADKNSGYAYYKLGLLYQDGLGITASESKAIENFQKSADLNDANGQHEMAVYYFENHNFQDAFIYAEKSALQGCADAAYLLGYLYANGKGVENNKEKAFEWYKNAAPKNKEAKMNLAIFYFTGEGTKQNYESAFQLFQELASKGETDAYNYLGYMYEQGLGTAKNNQQACIWYRKGAEANDRVAQYNLALSLWDGKGIVQDQEEALKWFHQSASQGCEQAIQFVNEYKDWLHAEEIRKENERKQKERDAPRICPGCQGTGRVLAGTGQWENCGLCGGSGIFQSFTGRWKDVIDAIDNMW